MIYNIDISHIPSSFASANLYFPPFILNRCTFVVYYICSQFQEPLHISAQIQNIINIYQFIMISLENPILFFGTSIHIA